ncbi:SAM-dependent methyltransferase [Legionella steelei]|nr:SAM-dependent methyltransferase [Legionella steelei]
MNKLFIVGCGIKFLSHMTLEVQFVIQKSDCVVYLVNDPAMKQWIIDNSVKAICLDSIYFSFTDRSHAYNSISQEIVKIAKENINTCFVIYGHPFFLTTSSEQIIRNIERSSLDIQIEILPGISSLDCLLCDLRIDPGRGGIQAYESTEFINKDYKINSGSHLVLWQIGVIGISTIINDEKELVCLVERAQALNKLKEKLLIWYKIDHPVVLYTASMYPSIAFEKLDISISQLDVTVIHRLTTAYVPPKLETK